MLGNSDGHRYLGGDKIKFLKHGKERIGIIDIGGAYLSNNAGVICYCGHYMDGDKILPECFMDIKEDAIIDLVK